MEKVMKIVTLAREIAALGNTPAEVTTGEHAAAQSQMASLGFELATALLAQIDKR